MDTNEDTFLLDELDKLRRSVTFLLKMKRNNCFSPPLIHSERTRVNCDLGSWIEIYPNLYPFDVYGCIFQQNLLCYVLNHIEKRSPRKELRNE